VLPAIEWAFNAEVEPFAYDLEAAAAILDEGGWVAGADGVRVKDGTRLSFTLMTNAGNEVRENIAALSKDNLDGIGFDVELEIIEFGTVVGNLLGQTYDAVIIGWTGLGSDPEDSSFWAFRNDSPGGGFNFVSYYNETVENNLNEARSLAGCDTAARGELYREIQQQIHDDAPYAFLYVPLANNIWHTRVGGIDPGPWVVYYNVEDWYITP
jgi:peptide/nickel transport system substrate-binding protein